MYRVAIVEDEESYRSQIYDYICQYGQEHQLTFDITSYSDGAQIVADREKKFDLIFFDIEMKEVNGMEAAEKIRERDENVAMIFITNTAQ